MDNIEFAEYRSRALKVVWSKFYAQFDIDERQLVRQPRFSIWTIDNICAVNWKNGNPINICVDVLLDYLKEIA